MMFGRISTRERSGRWLSLIKSALSTWWLSTYFLKQSTRKMSLQYQLRTSWTMLRLFSELVFILLQGEAMHSTISVIRNIAHCTFFSITISSPPGHANQQPLYYKQYPVSQPMKANLQIEIYSAVALGSGYLYVKYFQYNMANIKVEQLRREKQLSEFLYQIHQTMAFSLDRVLDQYEKSTRIGEYRRILCSFCEGKILQTCVGTSRNVKYYPEGSDVTFMDYSANNIQIAMMKPNTFIKATYTLGDVQIMPFQNNTFDTVIDTFGLDYVTRPETALKQIRRVCKPGGNILLMESGISDLWYMKWWQKFKSGQNLVTLGFFSDRDWQDIIEREGFDVVKKQRKINGTIYFYILKNNKKE